VVRGWCVGAIEPVVNSSADSSVKVSFVKKRTCNYSARDQLLIV
jgi:hypothetical protein